MIGALMELLGGYYVRGNFAQVEAIARSLLTAVPDDRVSLQFLGLAYYRSGRVDQAIEVFKKVVNRRRKPSLRMPGRRVSREAVEEAPLPAAVCYAEATHPSPDLARTWYDLGLVLVELGEPEKAVSAFQSALVAQPDFPEAMLAMGATALHAGDLDAAADGFGRLRTLCPEVRDGYLGLAQVFGRRRDFAAARACLAQASKLSATHEAGESSESLPTAADSASPSLAGSQPAGPAPIP